MNIEHESGENGGNGGSSCGFIALVAVVGFPSCGRKGRLMWDSPWIRSSRQNFSLLRRRWQCDSANFVSVNCQLPINLLSDCSKSPSKGPLSLLSQITADLKLQELHQQKWQGKLLKRIIEENKMRILTLVFCWGIVASAIMISGAVAESMVAKCCEILISIAFKYFWLLGH